MRAAPLLGFAWLAGATAAGSQDSSDAATAIATGAYYDVPPEAGLELGPDPGSTLPDEPAKGLVLVHCNICHGLQWIERSGGSLDGWNSRLRRMIRAGAQIPPEQIPLLADYLARALPERPRPPPTPPKHRRSSHSTERGQP